MNSQSCTGVQKLLLETALSLVGKVPYFWGGKSPAGWNDEWNTPKLVTSAGSSSTGTIRPYGLDCSGFTSWIYDTALGIDIGAGTGGQYPKTTAVSAAVCKSAIWLFSRLRRRWLEPCFDGLPDMDPAENGCGYTPPAAAALY